MPNQTFRCQRHDVLNCRATCRLYSIMNWVIKAIYTRQVHFGERKLKYIVK